MSTTEIKKCDYCGKTIVDKRYIALHDGCYMEWYDVLTTPDIVGPEKN